MVETILFRKSAVGVLLCFQLFMVIFYFLYVRYDPAAKPPLKKMDNTTAGSEYAEALDELNNTYPLFQDIHVMIFVGFGFLITFLKRYAYSGLGFTFLIAAVAVEWAILLHGFLHWGNDYKIYLSLDDMIYGEVAAAAVLISLGIVLGKVTPVGLTFMTIIEILAYVGNEYLCVEVLESMDWGGSMYLHGFGAYFGLGVSSIIAINTNTIAENDLETPTYIGDVTAMIGTFFLWLFWPSFLAASFTADQRYRIMINTYLSLISSCIVTFAMSSALNKQFKFSMSHIQNATLAGGVAIGTTCNAMIHPFGALIIGGISGAVSTVGYTYIQGFLRYQCRIHDTCGAHNLHGLPGVLGGISGIFTAAFANRETYGKELHVLYPAMAKGRSSGMQAVFQMIGILVTLAVASVTGILTGVCLRYIFPPFMDQNYYKDDEWWEGEKEEATT